MVREGAFCEKESNNVNEMQRPLKKNQALTQIKFMP